MKKHNLLRRFLTALALFGLLAVPQSAFAATDLPDSHWAASTINGYISRGIMSGYPDGTFRPEAAVTRAEFVKMVNSVFGYNTPAAISFGDVPSSYWGYNEIAKGVMAGYINGDENGNFNPEAPLTREEAASIICRVKGLAPNQSASANYIDSAKIATWAKPYVGAATQAGYMTGSGDGRFNPTQALTRAEAASVLSKAESRQSSGSSGSTYVPNNNVIHNTTGSSSSSSSSRVSDYTMGNNESTLSNKTITGNLYLPSGLGSKTVTLTNVTVDGTVYVRGGSTIDVNNCDFNKVVLDKSGVRFDSDSRSNIDRLEFWRNGTIEGRGYDTVIISDNSVSSATVNAPVENLQLDTDATLYLGRYARIDELEATSNADDATIRFNSNAYVDEMNIYDHIDIRGSGEINKMNCYASGITSSIRPNRVSTSGSGKRPTYTDDDDDDDSSSGDNNNNNSSSNLPSSSTNTKDLVVSSSVDGSTKRGDTTYETVKVTNAGVTVKNVVIDKNLTIEASVGDGTVTFEHVTVNGQVYIHGGGQNSVVFSDCTLEKDVYIDKVPTTSYKQPVGLKLNNGTTLKGTVYITNNANISTSPKEYKIDKVVINGTLTEPLLISANINKLAVESSSEVTLVLDNCTIGSLSASSDKKVTAKGKGNIEDVSSVKNLEILEEVNLPNLKPIINISGVPDRIEAKSVVNLSTCKVTFSDSSTATLSNATWTVTENKAEATINNNSLTANQQGTFSLSASVPNGKGIGVPYEQDFGTITVTQEFIPATSIIATIPSTYTLSEDTNGNVIDLSGAYVEPTNANNRKITWTVKGDGATLNTDGTKLTLTKKGTVTLTATVNNAKADGSALTKAFSIKVEAPYCPVGDIELTGLTYSEAEKAYIAYVGTDFTLASKITPPANRPNASPTNTAIKWTLVKADESAITNAGLTGNPPKISPKMVGQIIVKATVTGGADGGSGNYEKDITIQVKPSLIGDIIPSPKQEVYYRGQTIELDLDGKMVAQYKNDLEWSINNADELGRFMTTTEINNLLKVNTQSLIATLSIPADLPDKVNTIEIKIANKKDATAYKVYYVTISDKDFVPVETIDKKNLTYSMTGGINQLDIDLAKETVVTPDEATFKTVTWSLVGSPDSTTVKLNGSQLTVYGAGTYKVRATVENGDLLNGKDKSQDFDIVVEVAPIGQITVDNNTTPALAGNGYYYAGQTVNLTMDPSILATYGSDIEWAVNGTVDTTGYKETTKLFTFTVPADKDTVTVTAENTKIAGSGKQSITLNVKPFTEITTDDITITAPTGSLKLGETFTLKATTTAPQKPAVTWTVSDNEDSETTINSTSGLLTIGKKETAKTITITAELAGAKINAAGNALESVSKTQQITINLGELQSITAAPEMPDKKYYFGQTVTFNTDKGATTSGTLVWKITNIDDIRKKLQGNSSEPTINETSGVLTIPKDIILLSGNDSLTVTVNAALNNQIDDTKAYTLIVIPFTTAELAISAANNATTVEQGKTLQINATVNDAATNKTIKYSISGQKQDGTQINETSGLLTVDENEAVNTNIKVTATIANGQIDTKGALQSVTKTITIKVTKPADTSTTSANNTTQANSALLSLRNPVTMDEPSAGDSANTITSTAKPATKVSISGSTSVEMGSTLQLRATVTPSNATNKNDIKWTITSTKKSGTTISSDGLLTVASNETATSITVKATVGNVSDTITIKVNTPTRTNRELPNEAASAAKQSSPYRKNVVRAD